MPCPSHSMILVLATTALYMHWPSPPLLARPKDLFLCGLAAFLCARPAYLRGYCNLNPSPAVSALAFAVLVGGGVLCLIASKGLDPRFIPVELYALAIGAMLCRTSACRGSGKTDKALTQSSAGILRSC
ncbi:lysoplasmalogenase family protein [Pseudomonas farsensis]|uniref:lysoplasmalogenase family protein n=2 Tax=Pseudomonas TaxID=286 RepID=UPI001CED30A6|nr:lysoplasmalogenase family protein [Pseudomonas farsensis]